MVYPGWDDSTVSLLANWGPIAFLVFLLPTLYISEVNLRYISKKANINNSNMFLVLVVEIFCII